MSGGGWAGDDVDHAGWQSGFGAEASESEGCERCGGVGFKDDGIAAGQRRGEFPGGHQQGEIPWNDLTADAYRLWLASGKGEVEFVGPSGVVEKVGGDEWQMEVARFSDRVAALQRLEHSEGSRFFLNEA